MKALIRNEGETVTEDMGHSFIDWKTGAPLTNPDWFGSPYILVNDYVPKDPTCDFAATDPAPEPAQDPVVEGTGYDSTRVSLPETRSPETRSPETVTIDGKTYTKDELLALLNQTN